MIEDIKKEVEHCFDDVYLEDKKFVIATFINILDKYKDNDNSNKRLFEMTLEKNLLDNCQNAKETYELSKYKKAWEELKKVIWKLVDDEKQEHKFWPKREFKNDIDDKMQELKTKHGIEVE